MTLSRGCLSVDNNYGLSRSNERKDAYNISRRGFGAGHEDRNRTLTGGEAYTTHVQSTRAQRNVTEPNEGGRMERNGIEPVSG